MKAVAVLLVALVAAASASFSEIDYSNAFSSWMSEFGKVYTSDEFHSRFNVFKANMDFVEEWNAQNSATVVGLNKFADMSNEEYRRVYLGYKAMPKTASFPAAFPAAAHVNLPASADWRTNGSVTPVKDQGQCGSCWSFSTTGSVEGAHHIKTGNLVSLSEQNLMDCSTKYGNEGCNGGEMESAFKYIIANKGLDTEASYPYTAKDGTTCKYNAANNAATISSYKTVAKGNEADLLTAVATVGPISVAIDASHNSFQLYKSGVYYEKACSATKLDHGVLAVGYGTDATGGDYWLVKNSWGETWGSLGGYIWMSRNKSNNCGIATDASYPIV